MTKQQAPEILFIVNEPNWANDHKTRHLQRLLRNEYRNVKRYTSEVSETDLDRADLIVVYFWLQFRNMSHLEAAFVRNRRKLLIGVAGHLGFEGELRAPGLATLRKLARGVFVISKLLYREFQSLVDVPVFYTPNGVDTDLYRPLPTGRTAPGLRVGWAGRRTGLEPEQKGLDDFIAPAVRLVQGAQLVTAIREEKWRNPEEMRDFYHSLDVYVCASRSEGAPNPCLEAAACGVPVVTTRVGNMPELIQHGVNGLFVERDVVDIAATLSLLRGKPELRVKLSQSMLTPIHAWNWNNQAENYRRMFKTVLES
jgi:glycosyltransferase involved in cell wall biosynthesis